MGKMSHGPRSKTRYKMKKKLHEKGPITVNRIVKTFGVGDVVAIDIEPSFHNGMPFKRFQGMTGVVEGQRGDAYLVKISDQGKPKTVVAYPIHLKRA
ncbi:MAG: 50S ribosomal protein L21e [Candidatus Thermoplasmatota archaeon]|nr:50S ribosomal protein L21e [Candidatus Thermoplasmatota archaeon]